jgi:hypothetical protein
MAVEMNSVWSSVSHPRPPNEFTRMIQTTRPCRLSFKKLSIFHSLVPLRIDLSKITTRTYLNNSREEEKKNRSRFLFSSCALGKGKRSFELACDFRSLATRTDYFDFCLKKFEPTVGEEFELFSTKKKTYNSPSKSMDTLGLYLQRDILSL